MLVAATTTLIVFPFQASARLLDAFDNPSTFPAQRITNASGPNLVYSSSIPQLLSIDTKTLLKLILINLGARRCLSRNSSRTAQSAGSIGFFKTISLATTPRLSVDNGAAFTDRRQSMLSGVVISVTSQQKRCSRRGLERVTRGVRRCRVRCFAKR
jgi:hypothetical protein